ncbi:hypothetical protein [Streptomyces kronopolitis]|uniref:hypothetical protein n=1 Tax=Streptomyces kronopolitis TaxID=1612435 RepID=UPI00368FBDB7
MNKKGRVPIGLHADIPAIAGRLLWQPVPRTDPAFIEHPVRIERLTTVSSRGPTGSPSSDGPVGEAFAAKGGTLPIAVTVLQRMQGHPR